MAKTVKDWLVEGDKSISSLVERTLFDRDGQGSDEGLIAKYRKLYDKNRRQWGDGVYSPKWTSTFYTLLELRRLGSDPQNDIYLDAATRILDLLWYDEEKAKKLKHQDMCIIGMMLHMLCYAKITDQRIDVMIDYVLAHQFADHGWNCEWERHPGHTHSSVHTTLSVLEGLAEYAKASYGYRIAEVRLAGDRGEAYLLRKHLFLRETNQTPIFPGITGCHYPQRWKYDLFRALEYFADNQRPYDKRMDLALAIVEAKLRKGPLSPGTLYPGLIHFVYDLEDRRRMTTLIALKILKAYRNDVYVSVLNKQL